MPYGPRNVADKIRSAWWGESFVNELTRISEQAEKKLQVRRESSIEGSTDSDNKGSPSGGAPQSNTSNLPTRPVTSRSQTTA